MFLQRLGAVLYQCCKNKDFKHGLPLHAVVIKIGFESDLYLGNHLINMYAKCGVLSDALHLFESMPNRNVVSWSAIISGYVQAEKTLKAMEIFSQMPLLPNEYIYASVISACASLSALAQGKQNLQPEKGLELFKLMNEQGLQPDRFSFVAVLGICCNKEDLEGGRSLHCQTIKLGLDTSAFVGNVLMTIYSKCGSIGLVESAFWSIKEKDVISWNTFIVACSHFGDHAKALMVYREMENACDVHPDDFTLSGALTACAELASIRHGSQIHTHLIRSKLNLDMGVCNALINMYAKCGAIELGLRLFHSIPNPNLVSYNTMIMGLGNHGRGQTALEMFRQMKTQGFSPDSVTFVGVLTACSHAGLVDAGLIYFDSMKETYGISPQLKHLSCLVDMLGRAGKLEVAERYIEMFPFGNDLIIWGSLLSSCRLHKNVVIGERVAKRLLELQPSVSSPYVLLSNLYASNRRWNDVAEARKMLKGSGVKKEPGYSMIEIKGATEKFTVGDFSHKRIEEVEEILGTLNFQAEEFNLQVSSS
ncbi:putative tetratricopeptide-like helical domain superfamily [Dioscorea sansibarensis]